MAIKNFKIVGSVKVTRWNKGITLPLQSLFNIDPSKVINEKQINAIWHIGRFAISKEEKEGARLLKRLIALAIYPICEVDNNLMVAECDCKFVRGLNLLGIKTASLGNGIDYLGSETLPIYSTGEWLFNFLKRSTYFEEAAQIYNNDILHLNYHNIYKVEERHCFVA